MASDRLTTHPAENQIDTYLGDLATRLPGPRRRRRQILAELRDGLGKAVDDRTADGKSGPQAAREAIAAFGSPQAVAQAFTGELATAYARRTLATYVATGPLVGIWWLLLLQPHPWRTGLTALLAAIPVIPLVAIAMVTAATTLATTGRLMRWLPEASPHHAVTATIAIATLTLAGDLTVIVIYMGSDIPVRALAVIALIASLLRTACGIITVHHATAMRHGLTGRTPPEGRDGNT